MKTSHVRVRIKVWRTTKIIGNARYKSVAIMIEKWVIFKRDYLEISFLRENCGYDGSDERRRYIEDWFSIFSYSCLRNIWVIFRFSLWKCDFMQTRNQEWRINVQYTLLKSDVTRRDHVSVVIDAGSRSQFHSQFHSRRHSLRITLKYTTLVCMRSSNAWTMKPWQRSEWRLGFNSVLAIVQIRDSNYKTKFRSATRYVH